MDELMKMVWKECLERFGSSTAVDIHIDSEGVFLTTENKGLTKRSPWYDHDDRKINGSALEMVDR